MAIQKILKLTDVKTGRVFTMTKTAYDIAVKHGMNKNWDVMPETPKANPIPIINQHPEIENEITETKRKRKKSTENGETDNIS